MRARSRLVSVLGVVSLMTIGVVGLAAPPALATTITVNTTTDPLPDGSGNFVPNDGLCSLRAAITSAQNNSNSIDPNCATGQGGGVVDAIHISAALTGQTLAMSAVPFPTIYGKTNPVQIIGPTLSAGGFTIDGQNATRIFEIGPTGFTDGTFGAEVTLANLTVKRGNGQNNTSSLSKPTPGDGGAIYMTDQAHLTLDNVVLRDNTATGSGTPGVSNGRGGAIFGDSPTITNNGGAYISNHANGTGLANGTGRGEGGAIYLFSTYPSTVNGYAVLYDGNTASFAGGAVGSNPASAAPLLHLERSLVKGNSAPNGAVFFADNGSSSAARMLELHDSTITGNTATNGMVQSFSNQHSVQFLRDTFVNNSGAMNGGMGGFIANSIVSGSSCGLTPAMSGSRNLVGGSSGCTTIDALAAPTGVSASLAQNGGPDVQQTYALASNSNAIDNGNSAYCGTIDARTVQRGIDGNGILNNPQVGDCDIGSYEAVDYIVNFVTGTSTVLEGSNGVSVNAPVKVKVAIPDPADSPLPGNVTVPLSIVAAGTTARSPQDFTAPSSVLLPAGTVNGQEITFNVPIVGDDIAELNGEEFILALGGAAGIAVAEPKQHHVSIQDDEMAGVVVDDGGDRTTVSEATPNTEDTLSISLTSQPDYDSSDQLSDVTVHVEPDRDCTVRKGAATGSLGDPLSFVIANANWKQANVFAVRAVDDLYAEHLRDDFTPHPCRLSFSFDSNDPVYDATTGVPYDVDVIDNDQAGVTIVESSGTSRLVEGGLTDSYTIRLDTPPDPGDPVPAPPRLPTRVTITPDAQCDAGAGGGQPVSLSFTQAAGSWDTPKTVSLTAVDDPTVELGPPPHRCRLTHVVSGGDPVYNNLSAPPPFSGTPRDVVADVDDYDPPNGITNDPPQVDITTGDGIHVDEATAATYDTFQVVLNRQPLTQNVTVTLAPNARPLIAGAQVQLQVEPPLAAPTATLPLTFTPANWNVPQTVRVYAVNDDFDEAAPYDVPSLSMHVSISSTALGFNNAALRQLTLNGAAPVLDQIDVPLTVDDDDVSSVVPSKTSLAVSEAGTTDTYGVTLGSHPYADVSVTVGVSSQCTLNGGAPGGSLTLSFPAATWNVSQPIVVAAVDDTLIETPPQTCTITHDPASSGDVLYAVAPNVVGTATVTDNDFPRVLIDTAGGLAVAEATASTPDSYTVVLHGQPDAGVVVHFVVTDGQTTVAGTGPAASSADLTFTSGNWNVPQVVSVRAVNDAVDEPNTHAGAIAVSLTSTATGFATAPEFYVDGAPASSVPVAVSDDDTSDVLLAESGGSTAVNEGGAGDTVTIRLASQPLSNVTTTLSISPRCTVTPPSLTFTSATWSTPQTVTLGAVDNDLLEGPQTCSLTQAVTSSDPLYAALTPLALPVPIIEDEIAAVRVTAGPVEVTEGVPATDSYSVVLASKPTGDVHVVNTVSDGQTTLGPASATTLDLLFTPATWNTAQTVAVHSVDDAVHEGSPHAGAVVLSVTSSAFGYAAAPLVTVDSVTTNGVPVAVTDNDGPDLTLTVTDVTSPAVAGAPHGWTLSYQDATAGPAARGVVLTATVPANTVFSAAASTSGWICPTTSAGAVCLLGVGPVPFGPAASAVFAVVPTAPIAAGTNTISLSASVADDGGSGPDPNVVNNAATATTPLDAAPDLVVTVDDHSTSAFIGSVVPYDVTWHNTGPQSATGATLRAVVPANTVFSTLLSDAAWSCAGGAPAGSVCTAPIAAASGGTGTLRFALVPQGPTGTDVTLSVSAVDDATNGPDVTPADNVATDTNQIVRVPASPASPTPSPTATSSPAPTTSPTAASPSGTPECPVDDATCGSLAPTLRVLRTPIIAGATGHVAGTARPGSAVRLFAYTRPFTTYRLVRTTVADSAGAFAFDVRPAGNTRMYAETLDGRSPSAVLEIRPLIGLRMTSTAGCELTASGTVYPARPGQRVDIVYLDAAGRPVRAMSTVVHGGGSFSVGRRFVGGCGQTLIWRAITARDMVTAAGASRDIRATIRH
jgi:uncharacterized repeat protein (TIGR01451 family)